MRRSAKGGSGSFHRTISSSRLSSTAWKVSGDYEKHPLSPPPHPPPPQPAQRIHTLALTRANGRERARESGGCCGARGGSRAFCERSLRFIVADFTPKHVKPAAMCPKKTCPRNLSASISCPTRALIGCFLERGSAAIARGFPDIFYRRAIDWSGPLSSPRPRWTCACFHLKRLSNFV